MNLENISLYFKYVVLVFGVIWFLIFVWLIIQVKKIQKNLMGFLKSIVKVLPSSPDLDDTQGFDQKIDSFIAFIRDEINSENITDEVMAKITAKSEVTSQYTGFYSFENMYSLAKAGIEFFPLAGIIGTAIAIAAGLSNHSLSDSERLTAVVANFGESIYVTIYALASALVLILMNAWNETGFLKTLGCRKEISSLVSDAKKAILHSQQYPGTKK